MNILKYLITAVICLVIASCGGSGKDRMREPSRKSKRNVEAVQKRNTGEDERNNGNYRKPTQSRRSSAKPVERPENETPKSSVPNEARIEQRVRLEQKIWEASEKGSSEFDRLRQQAAERAKKMSQEEIDEASRRIKNLKKKM